MIELVWYLFSNVIITGDDLVKTLLKNVKLADSVVLLFSKNP